MLLTPKPSVTSSFPTVIDKQWWHVFMGHDEDCWIIKSCCFKNLLSFYCFSDSAIHFHDVFLGELWTYRNKHGQHGRWQDLGCQYWNTTESQMPYRTALVKSAEPVLGKGHRWVTSALFRYMCVAHLDSPWLSHIQQGNLKPELKLQRRSMLFWQQSREREVSRQKKDP